MWKPEHRRAAERRGLRYPSDLTDAEWTLVEPMIPPAKRGALPAKRNAGAGLLLEDATMSKLLWMLLVIGSAWADDDGRIHPKCVEENNTRRCWVERPATPSPADHGALVPVRPSTVSSIVFAATTVIATAVTSTNQPN